MKMHDAHFYNAELAVHTLPLHFTALQKRINRKKQIGHVSRLKCKRVTLMVDVARATVSFATVTKACLSQECLSPGPYTPIEPRKMWFVVICLHQAPKRVKNIVTKNAKTRIALTFKGSHWTTISTRVSIDFISARHHQALSSRSAAPFDTQPRRLHQQVMTTSGIATLP